VASSLILTGVEPVVVQLLLFGKSAGCALGVSHTTVTVTCDVAELKGKILEFRAYHVRRLHQGDLSYDKTVIADVAVLGNYTVDITEVLETLLLPPSRHKVAM
jgi:hypothetical protein